MGRENKISVTGRGWGCKGLLKRAWMVTLAETEVVEQRPSGGLGRPGPFAAHHRPGFRLGTRTSSIE